MADTAYTLRLKELSEALAALRDSPVPPMFSPEEVSARSKKQRNDEAMAVLAKMSGDRALSGVGGVLLQEALKAASPRYTEHGEFNPITGDLRVFPEYTRRKREEQLSRELHQTELRDAAARDAIERREDQQRFLQPYKDATVALGNERVALARERLEDARRRTREGKPLTGGALREMQKLGKSVDDLEAVKKGFENFNFDTARGVSLLGRTQDTLASSVPGFVPSEWRTNREAWGTLQRLKEIKDRHASFGATLTENEKRSWDQVTPPRGLDKGQMKKWLDEQTALITKAVVAEASAAAAAGGHKQQIEELTRGLWKAPTEEAPIVEIDAGGADFVFVPGKGTVPAKR